MSTDIVKAEERISILEKKDWNNEKDLVIFKKEFVGAQNLQSAIKEFYKSFILSKIIKESDLINFPDLNWFYVSEYRPIKINEPRTIEFFQAHVQRQFGTHLVERDRICVLLYEDGRTEQFIDKSSWGRPARVSFRDQSKIISELGGREFLDKIREKYSELVELSQKNIREQCLKEDDERYWIVNEYGQPLLVSTEKSLEFIKIELHEDEGFLQVVCPLVRDNYYDGPFASSYGSRVMYDVLPGEIVRLDFNIATNELINYSTGY